VLIGYQSGKKLLLAANVDGGLSAKLRGELLAATSGLERPDCPFANLPDKRYNKLGEGITAQDMKDFVWLEPKVTAQVGFREWTRSRRLRNPTILGLA
jgi:ATP-dependent DNA ligase